MRAQFGALIIGCVIAASCASNGTNRPYSHPKARTAQLPVEETIPPAPAPLPPSGPVPATIAAVPPASTAALPPPTAPSPETQLRQAVPVEAPVLPSEIPARAPRRDIPTWTTPPPKAAAPVAQARDVIVLAPAIVAPPSPTPIATPPLAAPNSGPALVVDRAVGTLEARLPCNRAGSPHCDLRIYQINVGTFVDGSPQHNPISGYGPGPHTGDIEGVIGALEHIKSLGFNMIWLTPIFDSRAGDPQLRVEGPPQVNTRLDGTGYFPRDYFKIDPQFGTLEQTQALIDQARVLGIKVMFDGVFGHNKGGVIASPSGTLPVDATAPSAYDGPRGNYPGRIVNYGDPRSTAFYKEAARYWIDTLGIDGWRLDQVYQIPQATLREITAEITTAANAQLLSGYVVGEMWGTAEQIRTVLGPSNNPSLASAFDFPTRYALVQALASDENGGSGKPASTINEAWAMGAHTRYPDHAIMNLMLGNHDLVRFGDLIERAGKGGPASPDYWAIHKMAFTFMAAWSGPITLYYGEEIGAEVAGFAAKVTGDCAGVNQCDDHVARNMVLIPGVNAPMSASSALSRDLKAYLSGLMRLRAATPALSSGSRTHIYSDRDIFIDLKASGDERYVLVLNTGQTECQITVTAAAVGITSLRRGVVAAGQTRVDTTPTGLLLSIPALGAAIIKLEGT